MNHFVIFTFRFHIMTILGCMNGGLMLLCLYSGQPQLMRASHWHVASEPNKLPEGAKKSQPTCVSEVSLGLAAY